MKIVSNLQKQSLSTWKIGTQFHYPHIPAMPDKFSKQRNNYRWKDLENGQQNECFCFTSYIHITVKWLNCSIWPIDGKLTGNTSWWFGFFA